eukprot:1455888-Amphidinium_carterae.3
MEPLSEFEGSIPASDAQGSRMREESLCGHVACAALRSPEKLRELVERHGQTRPLVDEVPSRTRTSKGKCVTGWRNMLPFLP